MSTVEKRIVDIFMFISIIWTIIDIWGRLDVLVPYIILILLNYFTTLCTSARPRICYSHKKIWERDYLNPSSPFRDMQASINDASTLKDHLCVFHVFITDQDDHILKKNNISQMFACHSKKKHLIPHTPQVPGYI